MTNFVNNDPGVLLGRDQLRSCRLCPRDCGVDRTGPAGGWCRTGDGLPVSSVCAHRGEEPVISGRHGIANIFFAHCNLQCVYCQNDQISTNKIPASRFERSLDAVLDDVEAILDDGSRRVGFVSPSHCLPQMRAIIEGLHQRRRYPVFVYNTNGYDRPETVRALGRDFSVYLPDMKYLDATLAGELSGADDYVEVATAALKAMYEQTGPEIVLDEEGLIVRGMIVRHLVLPGYIENSRLVLRWIAQELSPDLHISLMSQYHPTPAVSQYPSLGRCLYREEYEEVVNEFERLGFYRGWVQELDSPASYRPDFEKDHPFED